MARTTYWKRETFAENIFGTTPSPFWNQVVFTLVPGETLLRVRGHVHFFVDDGQSAIAGVEDLHVPYTWAWVWDHDNVPTWNGFTLYGTQLQTMKEEILFIERFYMEDDNTPAQYAGVNQGFRDARPTQEFDTRAQRHVPADSTSNAFLRFIAAGVSDVAGAPINFRPKLSVHALVLGPDV